MSKRNEAEWNERLRALGCRGTLPATLTQAVVDAARRRPLGERYVLADGEVAGLALEVGASGRCTFYLLYRVRGAAPPEDRSRRHRDARRGARRRQKIGVAGTVTLDEARARARRILVKVDDGQDPLALARAEAERQRTVRSYLVDVFAPKVLAPLKDAGRLPRMLAVWAPLLDLPLAGLTRDKIDDVLSARKVAGGTKRRLWNQLRPMLRDADEREALPAELARKLLRRPDCLAGCRDGMRVRWIGQHDSDEQLAARTDERTRLETALQAFQWHEAGAGDFLRTAVRLALATGMRRGELVRLTDAMINLRERTISLPADITKGNSARVIHLNDAAVGAIKAWLEVRRTLPLQSLDGALFPGDPAHWERRLTAWNRDFHALCDEAGITDLRFHDCRHDFSVRFLRTGGTMEQLQKALGHKSIVTTQKHYGHIVESDVRRTVLAM